MFIEDGKVCCNDDAGRCNAGVGGHGMLSVIGQYRCVFINVQLFDQSGCQFQRVDLRLITHTDPCCHRKWERKVFNVFCRDAKLLIGTAFLLDFSRIISCVYECILRMEITVYALR